MCGIVAVVRRPSDRRSARPRQSSLRDARRRRCSASRAADRALDARRRSPTSPPSIARGRARAARRRSGRSRCSPIPVALAALEHRADVTGRERSPSSRPGSTSTPPIGCEIEALNAALIAAEGRGVGARATTGCAPRASSSSSRAVRTAPAARSTRSTRSSRPVGARPARGARSRLRRACTCSSPVTASTSTTRRSPA